MSQELLADEGATTATYRWTNSGAGKPAAIPTITRLSKLIPLIQFFNILDIYIVKYTGSKVLLELLT